MGARPQNITEQRERSPYRWPFSFIKDEVIRQMYLYPENLTARPMLWLWTLRDVAFIGIGLLLSVLALT